MADPVVSITSGVPTSGTGTITTLGQVVAPQGASTSTGESGTSGPVRGPLVQGATLTSAPTYTTGTVNPLTTTLAGALRVDGSGATQPISGTITANQGGAPWSMKPDGTTWAMTSTSANVNVTNGSIAVTGTFWQATQPVSAASLPLPTGAATSANQPTNAAAASTTSGQTGNLAMGAVSTAAPSYTTATSNNLSLTTVGALRVDGSAVTQPVSGTFWQTTQPISGTVTANQGGTWNITNVSGTVSLPTGASTSANQPSNAAQGSTSSGQTGTLAMGAVTTGNPTYVTAQTSPLSLDTSGALRVNVIEGSGGGGVSAADESTFTAGTSSLTPSGGFYQSTTTNNPLTTGQQGTMQLTAYRALMVNLRDQNANPLGINGSPLYVVQTLPASENTTTWTSATAANTTMSLVPSSSAAYETIVGQITQTTTITAGAVTFEESFDNAATWKPVPAGRVIDPSTGAKLANPYPLVASTNQPYQIISCSTSQVRVRLSTVITGTGSAAIYYVTTSNLSAPQVFQSTAANLNAAVCGDTASGATDTGNPLKIGGLAKTTNPTAVTDGQRVNATFDKQGKLIAVGAIRQLKGVQKTSITAATETTVVTAGAAGVFNDVYAIVVTNKSATTVFIDFKDATAGTTRITLAAPASDTRGFTVPVDSAMVQAVAANNWTATVSSAVTSIEITMLYVSNL